MSSNKKCKYFPCHDIKNQDCDQCYCDVYPCKDKKLGTFLENGYWDCSDCTKFHQPKKVKSARKI